MPRGPALASINVRKETQQRLSMYCRLTGRSQYWVNTVAIEEWLAKQPEASDVEEWLEKEAARREGETQQTEGQSPSPKPEAA